MGNVHRSVPMLLPSTRIHIHLYADTYDACVLYLCHIFTTMYCGLGSFMRMYVYTSTYLY